MKRKISLLEMERVIHPNSRIITVDRLPTWVTSDNALIESRNGRDYICHMGGRTEPRYKRSARKVGRALSKIGSRLLEQ